MVTSTQQIFKSLNCPECDTPYSKTAGAENTPTQTYCCDIQAMCTGCYQKQRKIKQKKRVHQCGERNCFGLSKPPSAYYLMDSKTAGAENRPTQTWSNDIQAMSMKCYLKQRKIDRISRGHQSGEWDCFDMEPNPAYYLMELLSSGAFELVKQGKGYIQTTQSIIMPECPVCHEEYSLRDAKNEPFGLWCGHAVCNGCFSRMAETRNYYNFTHVHKCPLCEVRYCYAQTSWENPLKAFLREFEEKSMLKREAEMNRICGDCKKEGSLLEMFQCMDCGDKMSCGCCAMKKHRSHQVIDLEKAEIKKLLNVTRQTITPQIEAYNVCFPELQSDLIKNYNECQKKILNRIELGCLNVFSKAKEQQEACVAFGERLEAICEKYLGDMRSCNTGIEKLIDDINEVPK